MLSEKTLTFIFFSFSISSDKAVRRDVPRCGTAGYDERELTGVHGSALGNEDGDVWGCGGGGGKSLAVRE